ncbi:MAG: hypothetical protein IPP62_04085 [bacterium]|nr:hypothetical protein [bacterium]
MEKQFIGDFISLQDATSIRHLRIAPGAADQAFQQGTGISIANLCGFQYLESVDVSDFDGPCLRFAANSGSGFVAISCVFFTNAEPGLGAAGCRHRY